MNRTYVNLAILSTSIVVGSACADPIYVDDDAPNDPGPGDPTVSDPLEDGSIDHPFDSIAEAIAVAVSHADPILLNDGTYTGTGNRDITLNGRDIILRGLSADASLCIIDCEGAGYGFKFFSSSDVIIDDVTIRNGTNFFGGALESGQSTTVLNRCVFEGCTATFDGGAVRAAAGTVTITDCEFLNNTAGLGIVGNGGGLHLLSGQPTVIGCTFTNNRAQWGGALVIRDTNLATLEQSTFFGNDAFPGAGGAIMLGQTDVAVHGCAFTFNESPIRGGAIYVELFSSPSVESCDFLQNHVTDPTLAEDGGGAIYTASDLHVDCSDFSFNQVNWTGGVSGCGGAIFVDGAELNVQSSSFDNNFTEPPDITDGGGGAIRARDGILRVLDSTFQTNSGYVGGAIRADRCDVHLQDSAFGQNGSPRHGGAVEALFEATNLASIERCLFAGNTSGAQGGALFLRGISNDGVLVENSVFSANSSTWEGGGVLNYTTLTMNCCTFNANSAFDGAAVFNGGTAQVRNTIMRSGSVAEIGGVLNAEFCNVQGYPFGTDGQDGDPLFVDPDGADNVLGTLDDDLRLQPNSICIDSGNSVWVPAFMFDRDFNSRPVDDPGTPDIGNLGNESAVIDRGAYEFQGTSCRADVAAPFGELDIFDVLAFLAQFDAMHPAADLSPPIGEFDVFDVLVYLQIFDEGCP